MLLILTASVSIVNNIMDIITSVLQIAVLLVLLDLIFDIDNCNHHERLNDRFVVDDDDAITLRHVEGRVIVFSEDGKEDRDMKHIHQVIRAYISGIEKDRYPDIIKSPRDVWAIYSLLFAIVSECKESGKDLDLASFEDILWKDMDNMLDELEEAAHYVN